MQDKTPLASCQEWDLIQIDFFADRLRIIPTRGLMRFRIGPRTLQERQGRQLNLRESRCLTGARDSLLR